MIKISYYLLYSLSYVSSLFQKESAESKGKKKKLSVLRNVPADWHIPQSCIPISGKSNILAVATNPEVGILSEKEIDITESYSVDELLECIHSRQLTALEVTIAFCKRAAIANQLTNCCTELMFADSIERAKYLDEYMETNGKPIGPLHGLPVSLKDSFKVPGYDSTIGFTINIGNATSEFSNLPKLLYEQGCVFYVKSNIPQFLMTCDSDNVIFGKVLNPMNTSLTAGGSSGGEGSMIKQYGSIIGIGTDIGGSIRIPAICCGIYGFKPSCDRFPYGNQLKPNDLRDDQGFGLKCSAGPMSNKLSNIEFMFRAMLATKPWTIDADVKPIAFQESLYKEGSSKEVLTIGYFIEDESFPLHPPMKRSMLASVEKLKKEGHNLVLIKPYSLKATWRHCTRSYMQDMGFYTALRIIKVGELPIPSFGTTSVESFGLPPANLTSGMLSSFLKERATIAEFWSQVFIEHKLDVLLCPGAPHGAVKHDTYGIAPYTGVWNAVDYPALIIPLINEKPLTLENAPPVEEYVKGDGSFAIADYKPEELVGSVTHVQLVCKNFADEKLLGCAKIIDNVLNS
ncbi:hypothetical protein CANARDRAFT_27824 [[Candida] arabinofermentans NRRL YB-2248]|uniref:Amidase domain-containing protein n=1 Tax=[Candida] arabinofermentans NRRL YB-2248 TaxID=983967 RepID=A0A1E4T209_9ASCO|nr:hypothetical protein CANARDRAFT_27824 [[Candida] arabinofermentans NRRL YB-2248]